MDSRLLDILVCPICKGPLEHRRGGTAVDGTPLDGELICRPDRLAFPIRDGIPVMLVDEARVVEQAAP
ncbi:MAG: Trm112 family protein [Gammaproteobacteria bacterium]